MVPFKNLLCAALASSVLLSASAAEARFGKRSEPSDSDKKEKEEKKKKKDKDKDEDRDDSSSRVHDASPVTPGRTHDASPVGSPRYEPPPPPEPPRERVIIVEPAPPPPVYYVEPPPPPPPGYYAEPVAPQPPPEVYAPRKDTVHSNLRLGLDGGALGGGVNVNLFLAFEGERMGVDGRFTGMALPTDDGTGGTDTLSVARAHLTYAVVARDRVRLRVEAGISSASAPELKVAGPSFGASLDARLAGPLDFEASVQGTPFPYRQLDTTAALALKSFPWSVRAGWRTLLLNDAGLVDGEVHQDVLSGPYLGLGLFF